MPDDIVTRLRETGGLDAKLHQQAADEIERLRKERDEAEPLLNELWDRRTEVTVMRDEIKRLRSELFGNTERLGGCARDQTVTQFCAEAVTLQQERDEARREVCHLRPSVCLGAQSASAYAAERGWDCFKEDR